LKTLVYPGPFDAVEVPALGITAIKGEPVDVSDVATATALIRQGWTEIKAKKETAK
jgi:hypothetical protein